MKVTNLLLVAIAAALVGFIVWAFLPKPVAVDLGIVTRGPMLMTVDEEGQTRIKERYDISSPLAGRLSRIMLDPGDPVKEGKTLLAEIEPTDPALLDARALAQAEARVKAAEAGAERAEAQVERAKEVHAFAKTELARAENLIKSGGVSRKEYDNAAHTERSAREELRSATSAYQMAEFELELAKAAFIRTRPDTDDSEENPKFEIRSPITGNVLRVFQKSASVVAAGTRLLELGDPEDLEVQVDVLSRDAVKIKLGARAILEHWGGDQPLEARVRVVEPSAFTKISALGVEEQRVYVVLDLEDPPDAREALGDGYRVEARIVTWESDDALKLPAGSLFRDKRHWAVFKVTGGRARLQHLKIGHNNGVEAEILEGLAESDRVVLHPSDRIENGLKVTER